MTYFGWFGTPREISSCPFCGKDFIEAELGCQRIVPEFDLHECKGGEIKMSGEIKHFKKNGSFFYHRGPCGSFCLGIDQIVQTIDMDTGEILFDRSGTVEFVPCAVSSAPAPPTNLFQYGVYYWSYVMADDTDKAAAQLEKMISFVPGHPVTGQEIEARIREANPAKPSERKEKIDGITGLGVMVFALIVVVTILHFIAGIQW